MYSCPRTFAADLVLADSDRRWVTDDIAWTRACGDYLQLATGGLADVVRSFYGRDRYGMTRIELAEVELDAAGYAQDGRCYGRGARLFELTFPDRFVSGCEEHRYVRARNIPQLRAALRRIFPSARIVRT